MSGVLVDYGHLATYTGLTQQSTANQNNCSSKCTNKAANDLNNAALWCGKGVANGAYLYAMSAVGTKAYSTSQRSTKSLVNIAAVNQTTCVCPTGWTSNTSTTSQVTTDGRCKKSAECNLGSNPPPNGTSIGGTNTANGWGFTWGNGVAIWGTAANGGAQSCRTIQVSPAVCKF